MHDLIAGAESTWQFVSRYRTFLLSDVSFPPSVLCFFPAHKLLSLFVMLTFNLLGLGAACLAFQLSAALPWFSVDETHNLRYMLEAKPKTPVVGAPELLVNGTRLLNGTAEVRTSNMTVILEGMLKNASSPFANGTQSPFANGTHTVNETTPEMRLADGSIAVHGPHGVSKMLQEMAAHEVQTTDDARALHESRCSNVTQSANQTLTFASINGTQAANETVTILGLKATTNGGNTSDEKTKYVRRTRRANFEHERV